MPATIESAPEQQISLLARRFWFAHLLLVLAMAASIALATWQFGVWQASRKAQQHDNSTLPAVALTSVIKQGQAYPGNDIGRPVTLTGTWQPENTFFVADVARPSSSQTKGYWVVTPVLIGKSAIPVLRGWVATPQAPSVRVETVTVSGWLEPSDDTNAVELKPHVFGSLSLAALVQVIDTPLYSGYVVIKSASSGLDGVQKLGPTHSSVTGADWGTGLRNFLYGVQWWLFAALAVYLWWRWLRDQRRDQDQPATTEQVASTPS